VRPEEYLRAFSRFAKRYPVLRVMEHGGRGRRMSRSGRFLRRVDPRLPPRDLVAVVLFHWKEKVLRSARWSCSSRSWTGSGSRWRT
jgi:hypothetical protein